MEGAIRYLLKRHRHCDRSEADDSMRERERKQLKTLREKVRKIKEWFDHNEDKPGKGRKPKKSNLTDNESAKMKSAHGVIQGYDGVATVDARYQIVVHAEAFGEAQEHDLLVPMIEGTRESFQGVGSEGDLFAETKLTADRSARHSGSTSSDAFAGFHTEANMKRLFEGGIDAYVADILLRKRDPRFAEASRYKERHRQEQRDTGEKRWRLIHQPRFSLRCRASTRLGTVELHRLINGFFDSFVRHLHQDTSDGPK